MTYFVYLKARFYFFFVICSQVKIPLTFGGMMEGRGAMLYIFDVPRGGEGFNDFRWNPARGRGGGGG